MTDGLTEGQSHTDKPANTNTNLQLHKAYKFAYLLSTYVGVGGGVELKSEIESFTHGHFA